VSEAESVFDVLAAIAQLAALDPALLESGVALPARDES
jgi:hypothetical protein